MKAGALDRRIRLERAVTTVDAMNSPVERWDLLATVSASKQDVSDAERVAAQEVGSEIGTRFQVRWSRIIADLNPKDRLVCEGKTYGIVGVKELGRREGLEISALARAD